jgi:hypothetical protein
MEAPEGEKSLGSAIHEQYKKDIMENIKGLGKNLDQAKKKEMEKTALFAYQSAATAFLKFEDIKFEKPEDRKNVSDKLIAILDDADGRLGELNAIDKLSENEIKEKIQLVDSEIDALKTVGLTLDKGVKYFDKKSVSGRAVINSNETKNWLKIESNIQKKVFETGNTERALEEKYGFTIRYEELPIKSMLKHDKMADVADFNNVYKAIKAIEKYFDMYPPSLVKASGLKFIFLTSKLRSGEDQNKNRGVQWKERIFINAADISKSLHHEFFHRLDRADDMNKDDKKWVALMPQGKKAYTERSKTTSDKGPRAGADEITGFAREYGRKKPAEDQATVAQKLLNPKECRELIERCKTDEILFKKVEVITGCKLDAASGRFLRAFTREEYKRQYGYDDFEYYAKWSRSNKGAVAMNEIYWNMLIDGKVPKFIKS